MEVAVYGKEGCALCAGAKDKLVRLNVEFTYHDLKQMVEVHDGWRDDGAVAVLAGWAAIDNYMPLIMIDGEPHRYENFVAAVRAKLYVEELKEEAGVVGPDKILVLPSKDS